MTAAQIATQQSSGPTPFMCPRRVGSGLSTASSSSSLDGEQEGDSYSYKLGPLGLGAPGQYLSARHYTCTNSGRDRSFDASGSASSNTTLFSGNYGASSSTYSATSAPGPGVGATNAILPDEQFGSPSSTGQVHVMLRANAPQRKLTPTGSSGAGKLYNNKPSGDSAQSGTGSSQLETVYLYGTPTMPRKQLYQRL